ncbi:MAG: thioredoxin family protein [Candidatus Lambdaproteobacteria bacterium]|nr:thioredoxin family protein [Candidatus Lambdaproteobacteria bacterium]
MLGQQAGAQGFFGDGDEIPKVLATFQTQIEPAEARPGEHVRLLITARIAKGWYTYSVVPQGEFAPPPTSLKLDAGPLKVLGPVYETNPTVKRDAVFGLDLAYHQPAARFYQNLQVPAGAAPGDLRVAATLRYQVCNNRLCTPPRSESLAAPLRIASGPPRPAYGYMLRTIDYVDGGGNFAFTGESLEKALAQGTWGFLLLAAGFGLLALVTPCVFPMIPVTVSFFAGAGRRGRSGVGLALLFAAGIVLSSTVIGLALTFFMGATGIGRFATSPWVNLAVAAFFALFAFNLMGLYATGLPGGVVQGLDSASRRLKGPLGAVLMGVTFTATSYTCTMPFVGTLLVAATQGAVFWPLVGMLVFSVVFALPFLLLALSPQAVLRLRGQSGNWLVQVKVVLGLAELGAALKFASNADVIWQWGLLNRTVLLGSWLVLALVIALLLLGLLPWPGVRVPRRHPLRLAVAAFGIALAAYLAMGMSGRELDSWTEAYMPPALGGRVAAAVLPNPPAAPGRGRLLELQAVHALPWHASLADGLAAARKAGKPVFIDFTGYTCVNCRWMERRVFAEENVYRTLREQFVLVQLYTDGGPNAAANQTLQIERFSTIALPYYVILSPENAVLARHAGIMAGPEDFRRWLEEGRRQLAGAGTQRGS